MRDSYPLSDFHFSPKRLDSLVQLPILSEGDSHFSVGVPKAHVHKVGADTFANGFLHCQESFFVVAR
jgi:hypothetical protein